MLATPDEIVAALRDYGCKVEELPGWRERTTGFRFEPYGQAWHHDAFQEGFDDKAAAEFMVRGRPDLRGPIANGSIGNYGTVFLVAYGNANHAGRNEADVHNRLRRGLAPLGDAYLDADRDTVVGNPMLWGWECRNAGTGQDPWDQLDVMERAGAAMCDACGWPPEANAGHRELTARKIDPRGFDMHAFRADIARILTSQGDDDITPEQAKKLDAVELRSIATLQRIEALENNVPPNLAAEVDELRRNLRRVAAAVGVPEDEIER